MQRVTVVAGLIFGFLSAALANVIHVPGDEVTIQGALDLATEGDTVQVAQGIYVENIVWPPVNGISLLGSGETNCIIDGDSLASVIRFEEDLDGIIDTTTIVDGFTIRNGATHSDSPYDDLSGGGVFCYNSSPKFRNMIVCENFPIVSTYDHGSGGGFSIRYSSPILSSVIICNNAAFSGGGIAMSDSSPVFRFVTIRDNASKYGGGMHCNDSFLVISNSEISENFGEYYGGGVYSIDTAMQLDTVSICANSSWDGGGMILYGSYLEADHLVVSDNAASNGGGISMYDGGGSIRFSEVCNNEAWSGKGGGIKCINDAELIFFSVKIYGNSAIKGGGMSCSSQPNPRFYQCTITHNSADEGGGLYLVGNVAPFFSSTDRNDIHSNNTSNRRNGADIFSSSSSIIELVVDTFTVMSPTEFHTAPYENFTFDILNAVNDQVDMDLYVSVSGDNSNDGATPESPFRTIQHALSILSVDSSSPRTIFIGEGLYSPSTNGEFFPIDIVDNVSLVGESAESVVVDAESAACVMTCGGIGQATVVHGLTLTGGHSNHGGGIQINSNSSLLFDHVVITENTSGFTGGGVYCRDSSPVFRNVLITNNRTEQLGGGVYCYNSNIVFDTSLFAGNEALVSGGGLYCVNESSATINHATFSANMAVEEGGGVLCRASELACTGSLFWLNQPSEISCYAWETPNIITVACSDVQGGEAAIEINGNGDVTWSQSNIDADPLFCDPENGSYLLEEGSPCRGDSCGVIGYSDLPCDAVPLDEGVGSRAFSLSRSYPNPFNPSTTIEYTLPVPGDVLIHVYNLEGQIVDVLVDKDQSAGVYRVVWRPDDLASGLYFVEIQAGDFHDVIKMSFVK